MPAPRTQDVDTLDVSKLRGPLLDDYYGSAVQKADVGVIAQEIMRRHLAKLPSDTGNLKSTAKITYHRSTEHKDRRWEAEYSVGGPRADYIVPLEDEHHYLDSVLREMGFYTGDIVNGPTGKIPKSEQSTELAPEEKAAPPLPQFSSTRERAGLYTVTGGGRTFSVEQRTDIPGAPWRATDLDSFHDPHMGDFRTKGDAEGSLRDIINGGGD